MTVVAPPIQAMEDAFKREPASVVKVSLKPKLDEARERVRMLVWAGMPVVG